MSARLGHHRHGQLDSAGFRRADVQDRLEIHCAVRDAVTRLWDDEATVRERLGTGLSDLSLVRYHYTLSYPFPPSEVVEFFRLYYGPMNKAVASLNDAGSLYLRRELEALWSTHNRAGAGCTTVLAEYLEVIGAGA